MGLNADNVRLAVTGAFYYDRTGASDAPTGVSSVLDERLVDFGFVHEDGVTLTMPSEGDSTPIRAWQNGAIVRVIRTPSEDQPTFELKFIETKLEVIETYFNVTVIRGVEAGHYVVNTNTARPHGRAVLDVIDGDKATRYHAPRAIVTGVEEITLANSDPTGFGVTIECEFDPTLGGPTGDGGQLEVWDTSLRAAAS